MTDNGESGARCPECEGVGWMTYGNHSTDSEPCRTCGGRGQMAPNICASCDGAVGWVDCPTGGWWAHEVHPTDGHDAIPSITHIGRSTEP